MKIAALYLQSLLYIFAGINHFRKPAFYRSFLPDWLPAPLQMIYISGAVEIILGVLLVIPLTRQFAAWGIIILLIAVFPANIQMAVNYSKSDDPHLWIALVRLPVQLLLIGWAWVYTTK